LNQLKDENSVCLCEIAPFRNELGDDDFVTHVVYRRTCERKPHIPSKLSAATWDATT